MSQYKSQISSTLRRRVLDSARHHQDQAEVGRAMLDTLIDAHIDPEQLPLTDAKQLLLEALRASKRCQRTDSGNRPCPPPCHAA